MKACKILFFTTFLRLGQVVEAQELKTYQGEYNFGGVAGEAKFNYQLSPANESILQGEFKFESSSKGTIAPSTFERREAVGRFQQNKKEGIWRYLNETHQVTIDDVVDFKVLSRLQSDQIKISANYKSGIPQGKWSIEENAYEGERIKRMSQSDAITFKNGDFIGDLQYKTFIANQTQFLKGNLLEGGILHGEFALVYESDGKLVSEIRNFEKGFLLGIVRRDLNSGQVIEEVIFYNTIRKLNEIEAGTNKGYRIADENFGLNYADGFLSKVSFSEAQVPGNKFIQGFLAKLLQYEGEFLDDEGKLISSPLHTKRFVYELSRADQKAIEEIPLLYNEMFKRTGDFLNESTLKIHRQKSDSIALAYRFLEVQNDKFLELAELIGEMESKRIQFLDIREIINNNFSWLGQPDSIAVKWNERELFEAVVYSPISFETRSYQAIQNYLNEVNAELISRFDLIDKTLKLERDDREIQNLSARLEVKTENLSREFTGDEFEDPRTSILVRRVFESLNANQIEKLKQEFSTERDFAVKKQQGEFILEVMDELSSQKNLLAKIWSDYDQLDLVYQEEIFNPFTYTRYNQRVKQRLFESYEDLFESYIKELGEISDIARLKLLINKAQKLNQKLIELRIPDTRKLEQKLNKEKSLIKIESLLGL
jgi:antitoxin component YwqK of YwqJK toxin-antitoxin module